MGADATASYIQDSADTDSALSISTTRVGIGTASPSEALNIVGDNANIHIESADFSLVYLGAKASTGAGLDDAYFELKSDATTKILLDANGSSYFIGGSVGIGTAAPPFRLTLDGGQYLGWDYIPGQAASRVWGIKTDTEQYGDFSIITADEQDNTLDTVRFKIDPSGNVGIGTAAPQISTAWGSTNSRYLTVSNSTTGPGILTLSRDSDADGNGIGRIEFANENNADASNNDADGKTVAAITTLLVTSDSNSGDDSGGHLLFSTKPESGNLAERMRIDSAGDVTFTGDLIMADGKGINFAAMTSPADAAGMTAETLTDYEEGTWTPAFALATAGDSSWTHDRQVASYIKIGNICTFQCFLRTDAYSNSTGSGQLRITGLPFASDSTSNRITAVSVSAFDFAADNNPINGVVMADVQYITLYKRADANDGDTTLDENSSVNGANKNTIYVAGSYRTA